MQGKFWVYIEARDTAVHNINFSCSFRPVHDVVFGVEMTQPMVQRPHFSPTCSGRGTVCTVSKYVDPRCATSCPRHPTVYFTSMPPVPPQLLPTSQGPRLIVYHQTFHDSAGNYHSLLPLLTNNTGITHVIVAAIHLNEGPGNITLNDHKPDDSRYDQLWGEVKWLQGSGVKILGMLGGAAQGSYERLGGSEEDVSCRTAVSYRNLTHCSLKHTTGPFTP